MTGEKFDGAAQARGLRALQDRTGVRPAAIGAALGVDTQTYRRYFWGDQALKLHMIPVVAAAYGVSTRELLEEIGLIETVAQDDHADQQQAPEGWDLRAELQAASPDDHAFVERMFQVYRHMPYENQLIVVRGLREAAGEGEGETKGRRERWVPLAAPCVAAIREHVRLVDDGEGIPPRTLRKTSPRTLRGTVWLFPSHVTGRPWPSNTLWSNLQRALSQAGIDRIRPHDLRHSSITLMIARGIPVPLVAEIAGHRSSAFTMSRYSHVLTSQYRDASDAMGDLLDGPETAQSGGKTG